MNDYLKSGLTMKMNCGIAWGERIDIEQVQRRCLIAIVSVAFSTTLLSFSMADDWNQWRGKNRDGVWRETGVLTEFTQEDLKPVWRQPIGTGYSSPTVADDKVFLMDYDEQKQDESIRCFNAKTGQPIWEHTYHSEYRKIGYKSGPRSAVTIDQGHAYALGAMGQFHCINIADGSIIWKNDLDESFQISATKRMPVWGIACSPIIVGDLVVLQLGAEKAGVVAFNKLTGEEAWRSLDDRGQYSSPVLVKQNGQDVLVCWTGDSVAGLNPATGKAYWRHPFKPTRMPIGVATPIVKGNRIFMTSFYDGAMMLELSEEDMTVKELWHEIGPNEKVTKAIHSIISTPVWIGEHIYGVDSHGQLRCINPDDGSRVWEDLTAVKQNRWATIHFVPNGDNVWMLNEQGELMIAQLSPQGLQVTSREEILAPDQMRSRNRQDGVCWSHPAFAQKCIFVRNDHELVCINLAKR